MSSFKSIECIQKKEDGPDRSVSNNQFSSVTLNELAIKAKARECMHSVIRSFNKAVIPLTDINTNGHKVRFFLNFKSLALIHVDEQAGLSLFLFTRVI